MPAPNGFIGQQNPNDSNSQFNSLSFLVQTILARISTATLVQVKAVTNSGGISPVGFVDIVPLVNQWDGAGNAVPHGTIFKCPYLRLQGGGDAVIIDPKIGDIGIALFADKDISSVIANKAQANPGSWRRFDMSDGMYLGGVLNGVPTQYIEFSAAGIKIHSPTAVVLDSPDIQITCATLQINASSSVAITSPSLTHNGVNVGSTHKHGGVTSGLSDTGVPH